MEKQIRNSAKALIIKDGKMLAIKIKDKEEEWYNLPGGGQESEELLADAVCREVAEEMGIRVRAKDLLFAVEGVCGEKFHRVDLVFLCEYIGEIEDAVLQTDRNQVGYDWLPIETLNKSKLYPSKLRRQIMNFYEGKPYKSYLGNESVGDVEADVLEEAYTSFLEHNKERLGEDTEEFVEFEKAYKRDFWQGVENDRPIDEVLIEGERLIIRKARIKDADFMRSVELDADTCPWVANWPLGWRVAKMGDPDFLQVLLTLKDGTPIGFIIFRNMFQKEKEVQLKRIAIMDKGKGYGKEALYLAQKMAFEIFGTKYLYLTTKKENVRAQGIYKATGFVPDRPDPCTRFHMEWEDYVKNNPLR